jgi:hypothetical protein
MLCTLPKLMEEPPDDWKCAYCLEEKKDGKDYQKAVQACREMDLIKTKNQMTSRALHIDPLDDDDDEDDEGDDDDEDDEGDNDKGDEKEKERGISWYSRNSRFVSWQKPIFCLFPFLFYSHELISFLFEQHDNYSLLISITLDNPASLDITNQGIMPCWQPKLHEVT